MVPSPAFGSGFEPTPFQDVPVLVSWLITCSRVKIGLPFGAMAAAARTMSPSYSRVARGSKPCCWKALRIPTGNEPALFGPFGQTPSYGATMRPSGGTDRPRQRPRPDQRPRAARLGASALHQDDVPAIFVGIRGVADSDGGPRRLAEPAVELVGGVRGFVLGEIHLRDGAVAAPPQVPVEMRRTMAGWRIIAARLDRDDPPGAGSGGAQRSITLEVRVERRRADVGGVGIAAGGIALPELEHRAVHRMAVAV